MISANLQPIRMGILTDLAPKIEAYMATYVAAYNNQPVSARMLQSYQRAWGVTDITMFPRVDGGRPGFALLRWLGDGVNKAIVAIEGTTSYAQLWTSASGANRSLNVAGLPGRYWGTAVTYADQIKTLLDGTGLFGAVLARPNSLVEFAGFSLGAGVAEVLAYRYKLANPLRQMFLYKFAAPRFGNAGWNAGRNRQVPVVNILFNTDPIHAFPFTGTRLSFSEGLISNPLMETYQRDPTIERYDFVTRPQDGYPSTFTGHEIGLMAQFYQTYTPLNPWFYHDRNQYRYLMTWLAFRTSDLLDYRTRYLEHNDENTWQVFFNSGSGVRPEMLSIATPAPDDATPQNPEQLRAVQNPPPAQEVLDQGNWNIQGGTSEGGSWESSRPVEAGRVRTDRRRRVPAES